MAGNGSFMTYKWDFLSEREGNFCDQIMAQVAGEAWAQPILQTINNNGGITAANKAALFELRFGYALHQTGLPISYEVPGEGGSTLDFGFSSGDRDWLVELMRLEETDAAREATEETVDEDGIPWFRRILSSDANDPRQSPQGETLKAIERICQKCERNERPYKFPAPSPSLRVLLVDFRTIFDGGDRDDRIHVGLGTGHVRNLFNRFFWLGKPILGAFHPSNRMKGASFLRERLHFIGFVNETEYQPGAFSSGTQFMANPRTFKSAAEARDALSRWPLQPVSTI
jgi:hypothetical protein